VLLVEDNPGDAGLLEEMLKESTAASFHLVCAERLSAGLERLNAGGIDVVLLDLSLPDSHGLETLAKTQARAPQLPIIVQTSLDDEALAIQAVRNGAQDYLIKGQVDANLLTRSVRYAIERKRVEEERRQLQEQLAQAVKMEAVGTLAGGIAHEFNNINGEIIAFIDLTLEMDGLPSEARRNLEEARSSAVAGAELTKSLLAFARKDVGERKRVHLRHVVDRVLQLMEKQLVWEGITVALSHAAGVPFVLANASLLESVVMNLVINARHAMLKSHEKRLIIDTGLADGRAFMRIKDTGCGIPEANIGRIFEPFFTTKGALASGEVYDGKAHGTGLGLSVCHAIVEGHGGELTVNSQVGKGATFTVLLPACAEVEDDNANHGVPAEARNVGSSAVQA
jgi:signal transduction histidine kinase